MTAENIDWRRIRAVTFDVGGTLIEPWPSVGHVYAEVAAKHGLRDVDPAALTRAFASVWRARNHFNYSQSDWFEVVRRTFGEVAGRLPDVFFPAVYQRFAEPDAWRVFDDVRPLLPALARRGLRLGVISNWDERLSPLLRALRLHEHFETVVVSCDVGRTKPALEIFEEALCRLRLSAGQVLHVGDALREDVEGARAAGLAALQIARDGTGDLRRLLTPLTGG